MRTWFKLHYHPASVPRDFGTLVLASLQLWLASLRLIWRDALLASLLPMLPWLGWWWSTRAQFADARWQAWLDPGLWQPDGPGLALGLSANLAGLWFLLAVLHRQGMLARGPSPSEASLRVAWHALPQAVLATVLYAALMLLALSPLVIGCWVGLRHIDPALALVPILLGLLASAVPLAWVSVAAVFIYPPILLDAESGPAAQRLSFRLVHGHWVHSAMLLSVTSLASLGLLGTIGALPFALTGTLVVALDGLEALLRPGWLVFGQLLGVPFTAIFLPLATAGYLVCHEDLRLRQGRVRP